ncbi:hypothetical protein [Pseudobacteriovorax antillogorgiicola]|uniref:Long-chain fatty acid transport protein n=1 Tax=Pseudobacteriovorax antillogorgiicola TaxID=1513793 RepID=A0A1Y6CH00_9BACT|nr:hypothetical protein [Pseudobacteriovorax antillogorgiicola]TCS48622.1 hypothetical protein EDD56_11744 [Pseudobacteriovorax antillogorgiicola]SMF55428.1 hypothetical protein SAMN06296036_117115 [Pseudobacteriovorax antillogorgiicola]
MIRLSKMLILTGCLAIDPAYSQEVPESFVPVRSNGMGGAFTAISNDENAVWTNPAGIARVRKARSRSTVHIVKIPNIVVGINTNSQEFIDGISESGNEENAQGLSSSATDLADKPLWSTLSMFPLMMLDLGSMPSIVGAYSHTKLKAVIDSENTDQARTEAISDVGGVWGLAFTNRTNRLNFGLNLRYVARYAYEDTLLVTELQDANTLQTRIKENSNKSSAFAVDLGFMWTFADFWFPTIGIAVFNAPLGCKDDYLNPFAKVREKVCGTVFTGDIANPDAVSTIDPTDIRVGISITPRLSRKIAARLSVGFHHLYIGSGSQNYGLSDIPIQKQTHAGIEFVTGNPLLPSPFSVSVGYNQGFYSMGASVRLSFLSLDFATFGRDISTSETPQEDRRIMAGLSIDF